MKIQKKNDTKKVTASSPSQKSNSKKNSPQRINSTQLGVKQNQKKQFEGGSFEKLYSNKKVKIWIALVAGTSTHVSIEVITDEIRLKIPQKIDEVENSQLTNQDIIPESQSDENKPLNVMKKSFTFMSSVANLVKQKTVTLVNKSQMEQFINIAVGEDLRTSSEIGWVSKNKLVLTINNQYYLISLDKRKRMCRANNGIYYGQQVVNMNLFCSIVKKKKQIENNKEHEQQNIEIQSFMQTKLSKQIKNQLIESQMSIQRMETASLIRFAFIYQARQSSDLLKKCLLFFMPAEELQGSNMFSQLSSNYNIVQPYLEMIDSDIIKYMNEKVHNISKYLSQKRSHFKDEFQDLENIQKLNMQDNTELFGSNQGQVHMYQSDIGGYNAIDYAFKRNSIFCIKAFVETLLILTGQNQFNNCFDKAILKMISREMDVKELVNSSLFFVPIWTQYSVFSPNQEPLIVPYNNDIDDLEFDDPNVIFYEYNRESQQSFDKENVGTKEKNLLQTKSAFYQSESQKALLEKPKEEQYEMQFKYINLQEIQGNDKISISRTLKDCQDIELFEQESIQQIIDYKWNTYTRKFFLFKFYVYLVFLIFYFIDLERAMNDLQYNKGVRTKDEVFIACKTITFGIQLMFLLYEILQAKTEGKQYFSDIWNYIEILGLFIFGAAGIMDILYDQVSDTSRILWTISIFSALQKVAYLVRVFTQLNFLVTMLGVVINDIGWFICLFFVYVLFFAEINHIYQINTSQFQRLPNLAAQFIFCVKNALGDFSLMDPSTGFDQILGTDEQDNNIYGNSIQVMVFTYLFWLLTIFYLTMIFMNFIIAVIGDSFNKVLEHKQAHDYFTRINMIYEREVYFGPKDFEDRINFPNILIVRQGKENNTKIESSSKQKEFNLIKTFMKLQIQKHTEQVSQTVQEQKTHLSNSIKILENDITNQNKDLEKIQSELKNLTTNTNQITDLCKQNINLNNILSIQQQQIKAKESQPSDSDTISSDSEDIEGDNIKKMKGQMTIKIKQLSTDSFSKKKPVLEIKNDIDEVVLEEQNSIRKQAKQKLKKVLEITSPQSNKSMITNKDIEILSNGKQSDVFFPIGPQSPTNAHGIWMISQNVKKQLENNSKLINKQVQNMKETFHSKVVEIVKENNLLRKQLQISSELQRQSVEWMQLMQQRFEETNNQNSNQIKNLQKSINYLIQNQTQSSNRISPKEMPLKTTTGSRSSSTNMKNILKLDKSNRIERNFSAISRLNSTQIPIYNSPKFNSSTQSREITREMLIQTPDILANTYGRNNSSPKNLKVKNLK